MGVLSLLAGLFSRRDESRTAEDPTQPLTWAKLASMSGGNIDSTSGIKITKDKALRFAPWWQAIRLLSGDVAQMPIDVLVRGANGGKSRDTSHPAWNLVRHEANSELSAYRLKELWMLHALMRGNSYTYIVRGPNRRPTALVPLDPDITYPVRVAGRLWYQYDSNDQKQRGRMDPRNVLHIAGLGWDGMVGYSVISYAADSLGLGLGAHGFSSRYFKHGSAARLKIEIPQGVTLSEPAVKRLRESIERNSGWERAHVPLILEDGATAETLSFNARDSQLVEALKFGRQEAAAWFNLPPHKLGDEQRTSYNSLFAENDSYLKQSLNPWLCRIEAELRRKLMTDDEKASDTHIIRFERKALLSMSPTERAIYNRNALAGAPWEAINEVRDVEGLNPIEGGDGLPATNNFPGKALPAQASQRAIPEPEWDRGAYAGAMQSLAFHQGAMIRMLSGKAARAARHGGLNEFLAAMERETCTVVREHLQPAAQCWASITRDNEAEALDRATGYVYEQVRQVFAAMADAG